MAIAEHGGVPDERAVLARLSRLDRYLPLWIALAMVGGLVLGTLVPSLNDRLEELQVGTVSLPIAIGLLMMMYPVLAKVRYEDIGRMSDDGVGNWRFFGTSLFLSWVVGPALMFALAWIFLADQPAYRTGVIVVGLARCIAMVLVWNDIALGDRERAAVLVVFNALFQVAAYALLGYFYLTLLPGWLGFDTQGFEVGIWEVARTVLVFLGIPLLAGFLTRYVGIRRRGRAWYEQEFVPRISPLTLYGLLFTIVLLFAIQGEEITGQPLDVARIAVPLLVYFALMWVAGFAAGTPHGLSVSADRRALLHRRQQRLRARDRRRRRRLRRHLGPGSRRGRRPADRGARARRPRVRRALAPPPARLAGSPCSAEGRARARASRLARAPPTVHQGSAPFAAACGRRGAAGWPPLASGSRCGRSSALAGGEDRKVEPVPLHLELLGGERDEPGTLRDPQLVVEDVVEERLHLGPLERRALRVDEERAGERLVRVALHASRRSGRRTDPSSGCGSARRSACLWFSS